MKSTATSVDEYLASLPDERREELTQLRALILKNLPKGYQESMTWGMPTYEIPLEVYPDTYNKKPLMYAAFAAQKNNLTLYLTTPYMIPGFRKKLEEDFAAAGKRLNMGGSCMRFQSLQALPLHVIASLIAAVPPAKLIELIEVARTKPREKKAR